MPYYADTFNNFKNNNNNNHNNNTLALTLAAADASTATFQTSVLHIGYY